METFSPFLDHVMKNFTVAYPYGLSKTEVTRLSFLAWCLNEANTFQGRISPPTTVASTIPGAAKGEPVQNTQHVVPI
jgi:hypothetical protein